ncbi:hypothetical protein ABKN59_002805 [Abortiporus biennis]
MPSPYSTPGIPGVPNTTPMTNHTRQALRAPVYNPYDKFTQNEFDEWINDITGKLKRALGREEPEIIENHTNSVSHTGDISAYDDSIMEDSFAEIKARRLDKGKQRAVEDGEQDSVAEDSEEVEEEDDLWGRGWHEDGQLQSDEEAQDDEAESPRAEAQNDVIELLSSDEEEEEEIRPVATAASEEYEDEDVLEEEEVEGEDDEDEEEGYEEHDAEATQWSDGIYDEEDENENAEVDEFDDHNITPSPSPSHQPSAQQNTVPSDDVVQEDKGDNAQDEEQEAFPPSSMFGPSEIITISDPWVGPSTYAEDFYSGGDLLPGASHIGSAHLLPTEVDHVVEIEHNVDEADNDFPPKSEDPEQPADLSDPWSGPRMFAEDLYTGGELRGGISPLTPSHLTPAGVTPLSEEDIGMSFTPGVLTPEADDQEHSVDGQVPSTQIDLISNVETAPEFDASALDELYAELENVPLPLDVQEPHDFGHPSDMKDDLEPEILEISDDEPEALDTNHLPVEQHITVADDADKIHDVSGVNGFREAHVVDSSSDFPPTAPQLDAKCDSGNSSFEPVSSGDDDFGDLPISTANDEHSPIVPVEAMDFLAEFTHAQSSSPEVESNQEPIPVDVPMQVAETVNEVQEKVEEGVQEEKLTGQPPISEASRASTAPEEIMLDNPPYVVHEVTDSEHEEDEDEHKDDYEVVSVHGEEVTLIVHYTVEEAMTEGRRTAEPEPVVENNVQPLVAQPSTASKVHTLLSSESQPRDQIRSKTPDALSAIREITSQSPKLEYVAAENESDDEHPSDWRSRRLHFKRFRSKVSDTQTRESSVSRSNLERATSSSSIIASTSKQPLDFPMPVSANPTVPDPTSASATPTAQSPIIPETSVLTAKDVDSSIASALPSGLVKPVSPKSTSGLFTPLDSNSTPSSPLFPSAEFTQIPAAISRLLRPDSHSTKLPGTTSIPPPAASNLKQQVNIEEQASSKSLPPVAPTVEVPVSISAINVNHTDLKASKDETDKDADGEVDPDFVPRHEEGPIHEAPGSTSGGIVPNGSRQVPPSRIPILVSSTEQKAIKKNAHLNSEMTAFAPETISTTHSKHRHKHHHKEHKRKSETKRSKTHGMDDEERPSKRKRPASTTTSLPRLTIKVPPPKEREGGRILHTYSKAHKKRKLVEHKDEDDRSIASSRASDKSSISAKAKAAAKSQKPVSQAPSISSSIASTSQISPTAEKLAADDAQLLARPLIHAHGQGHKPPPQISSRQSLTKSTAARTNGSAGPSGLSTSQPSQSQPTLPGKIPVTRSNCRFHKISIPKDEPDGPRALFVVPGCSLSNRDLMAEEDIDDLGDATMADNPYLVPDVESLDFEPYLISVLRQLVRVDYLREQEIFYLPMPGEEVKYRPKKPPRARKSTGEKHTTPTSPQTSKNSQKKPISRAESSSSISSSSSTSSSESLSSSTEYHGSSDSDSSDDDEPKLQMKRKRVGTKLQHSKAPKEGQEHRPQSASTSHTVDDSEKRGLKRVRPVDPTLAAKNADTPGVATKKRKLSPTVVKVSGSDSEIGDSSSSGTTPV